MKMRFLLVLSLSLGLVCATSKLGGPTKQPEAKTPTTTSQETPASTPVATPATTMVEGRYFSEPGAPDPLACNVDSDCQGDTVTDAGGCCVVDPTPYPQTNAYHTWLRTRRMAPVCAKAGCPPPQPPRCRQSARFK